MDQTTELIYEGPPALVGLLAQMLRDEGLRVDYEPPMERRGADSLGHLIAVHLVVSAAAAPAGVLVKRATERFLDRFPKARVRGKHEKT